jgi:hypothetical protein
MPKAKLYRCDRVRQINGSWEFFFARREGVRDHYAMFNVDGVTGTEYVVGQVYEVPMPRKPRKPRLKGKL